MCTWLPPVHKVHSEAPADRGHLFFGAKRAPSLRIASVLTICSDTEVTCTGSLRRSSPPRNAATFAMVPYYPEMRVRDLLEYSASFYGKDRAEDSAASRKNR